MRKLVLDILILFFIVVFLASITNFASAANGQNEVNTTGNSVGSNNTVNNTVNNNTNQNTTGNQSGQINTATGILGDVDGSGTVNASDAARLLIYAANMGVRFEAPTQQMLNVADINKDGVINASDAALVLIYAAKYGATGNADWNEILNEM